MNDTQRLNRLIKSMCPTFLQNNDGWVCLDEGSSPPDWVEEPMANFKHWTTAREAIDNMGARTPAGLRYKAKVKRDYLKLMKKLSSP